MVSRKCFSRFMFALLFVSAFVSCCYATEGTLPFFKIYEEYRANPFKAGKKWKGETICIEGTVRQMFKETGEHAYPVVLCWKPKPDARGDVVYYIGFSDTNPPMRLYDIEKGQTVKFRGTILNLSDEKDDFLVTMICHEIID